MKTGVRAFVAGMFLAGLAMGTAVTGAQAQSRVDAKKDWSVFESGQGAQKVCWIVSQPLESTATRGGKKVEVNRGDIFLMVAVRPGDKVSNEVSFLSGYPFKGGSKVTVSVGDNNFTMFTEGENAWTSSAAEDGKLTGAFRRGSKARVRGESQRGTTTSDTFSLSGFTAAMKVAQGRCG